jgi:5-methylcytosine-specific restriction endonuclease McrA
VTRNEHAARPNRESLSKRLGKVAKQIKARDEHRCFYCKRNQEESGAHLHLDHLIPKVAGGADVATNLLVSCRRCNTTRHDMTLEQWAVYAQTMLGLTFTAQSALDQAARPLV